MDAISIDRNTAGRLLPGRWPELRVKDATKFFVGNSLQVFKNNQVIGVARILSVTNFYYDHIPHAAGALIYGKDADYAKKVLKGIEPQIQPTTEVSFIVFEWVSREINAHRDFFTDYWKNLEEATPHYTTHQPELFQQS